MTFNVKISQIELYTPPIYFTIKKYKIIITIEYQQLTCKKTSWGPFYKKNQRSLK